jgi:hypothetical protein
MTELSLFWRVAIQFWSGFAGVFFGDLEMFSKKSEATGGGRQNTPRQAACNLHKKVVQSALMNPRKGVETCYTVPGEVLTIGPH